jgi:hypothetical protein
MLAPNALKGASKNLETQEFSGLKAGPGAWIVCLRTHLHSEISPSILYLIFLKYLEGIVARLLKPKGMRYPQSSENCSEENSVEVSALRNTARNFLRAKISTVHGVGVHKK